MTTNKIGYIILLLIFLPLIAFANDAPDVVLSDTNDNTYSITNRPSTPLILIYNPASHQIDQLEPLLLDYDRFELGIWLIVSDSTTMEHPEIPILVDDGSFISAYHLSKDGEGCFILNAENEIYFESDEILDKISFKQSLNQMLEITGVERVTWGKIKSLYLD